MNTNWMTLEEAAEYCKTNIHTIRGWLKRGLKRFKPGKRLLFRPEDLDEFIVRSSVTKRNKVQ
jgi:excisionase family DNA binding protein